MLIEIKSKSMHPLSGALPLPNVLVRVTYGALVAHRHSFALIGCRTFQHRRTYVPISVSLWNKLSDIVFEEQSQCFLLAYPALSFITQKILLIPNYLLLLFPFYIV